jgi:hypothetical protein
MNDHTGIRTHDLPACSIVSQPTTLARAPQLKTLRDKIQDNFVWVSIDETQDREGQFIANMNNLPLIFLR